MRTTGFIDSSGVYHRGESISIDTDISSTEKEYRHDRDREKHRADIVQPWKNGKLNSEFELLYPEEAQNYKGQNG